MHHIIVLKLGNYLAKEEVNNMLKKMMVFVICLSMLVLLTGRLEVKAEIADEAYIQEIADAATAILYKGFGEYYDYYAGMN